MPFAVLVVRGRAGLSWEWGRLVHGAEADLVHRRARLAPRRWPAMLAAFGFVGLGLLALPIGAILAMLLSLGRNSMFSALGVFYAGLPAVALIWLRSDADARAAGGDLPDRGRRRRGHGAASWPAGCWAGPSCGRAFRPTRPGPVSSARWWRAAVVGACFWFAVAGRFAAAAGGDGGCARRSWRRPAISPSRPSSAGSAPRTPARSSLATAASWIASTAWWRRRSAVGLGRLRHQCALARARAAARVVRDEEAGVPAVRARRDGARCRRRRRAVARRRGAASASACSARRARSAPARST